MPLTAPPPQVEDLDAGVIEEARARERRHRRIAATVVVAAVATMAVLLALSRGGPTPLTARTSLRFPAAGPAVNAMAFAHDGDLAFISRGTLWVLDGSSARLRRIRVPLGLLPESPTFSADGRWLSYLAGSGQAPIASWTNGELWIARADGSDPREIGWLKQPSVIGWSPRADELAVTEQGTVRSPYGGALEEQTSAWLVAPNGSRRKLMSAYEIEGGAWAPDGTAVAISSDSGYVYGPKPWTASLAAYPVAGGGPRVWLALPSTSVLWPPVRSDRKAEYDENVLLPVGWWPRWGIGFWATNSSSDDPSVRKGAGLELWHLSAPGDTPKLLGETLSDGAVSPIVASANGELAITENGGAEPIWQDPQVERCSPATQTCGRVAEPRGAVSLDPAWSPNGSKLVYLVGRNLGSDGNGGFAQSAVARFYDTLQLWLYTPATGVSRTVPAAEGAVVPVWARSGNSLLFVADDGLWRWKNLSGRPREVAGPLLKPDAWNAFFAQIDWSDQFAWSR
jgi:Tol biopolymer transport system component